MSDLIYNSRNYYRLLNLFDELKALRVSTTVEITIGYLTNRYVIEYILIYNSRNYYRLLNGVKYI